MSSIMNILMTIFSPAIFWPIIGTISIGFVIVVIFSILQDTKSKKQDLNLHKKITELQDQLSAKEDEITKVKELSNTKETDYNRQLMRLEEQISENEASRTRIKTLEMQLKEKDEATIKEKAQRQEVEEKLKNAQPDIEKAKKEASLKAEMYNGLKNQYDELEGQLTSQAKKDEEVSLKIKKLEDELKEAKLKLLEALKHPKVAPQEEKIIQSQEPESKLPDEKSKGLSVSSVYSQESKPGVLKQEAIDKPKEQNPTKPDVAKKQALKSEAKVRLAQVMQEAAKVAAKREEKSPQETKEPDKQETANKPPIPEEPKSINP